jgi:hypothetical protein
MVEPVLTKEVLKIVAKKAAKEALKEDGGLL